MAWASGNSAQWPGNLGHLPALLDGGGKTGQEEALIAPERKEIKCVGGYRYHKAR